MIVNHLVELDLDTCSHTFGSSPCTASNASGNECYNTRRTCQDEANYAVSTKTITLSEAANAVYPDAIPCVEKIEFAPTEINPKEGLDYLGKVKITAKDFSHNDSGIDPYFQSRNYIASDQGTFWGKLLARNPHHFGRKIRVKQIIDGTVTQTYLFIIESISPPDNKGMVKITAKDPLFLAGSDQAKVPAVSSGVLAADITDTATSLTLDDATTYPSAGTLAIGRERLSYTSKTGDTLNGLLREQWGSTASSHSAGDHVQLCKTIVDEPLIDVVNDLISNHTTIDNSLVPYADWQAEQSDWLSVYTLNNIISEPTDVLDLLTQIQIETGTVIWWDQEDQEIKLQAAVARTQNQAIETLTDASHLMGPIEVKEQTKERISQVWIYYGIQDYAGSDEAANFSNLEIRANYDAESAIEYGTENIDVIYSHWLTGVAQTGQVATRRLSRYENPPKLIEFSLDSKDSALKTGDHFYLQTASIQSVSGNPVEVEMQMLAMRYFPKTLSFRCKAQTFNYLINQIYGYITIDAMVDYTSATDEQKLSNSFICDDNGEMSTGDEGYLII